jgi:sterol desaturase/sphingolipid hydroxylase (fatty acid hydroxylase superfamily)
MILLEYVLPPVLGFLVLTAVFRVLELARPQERRLASLRRGYSTDVIYFALGPAISKLVDIVVLLLAVAPLALIVHGKVDEALVMRGFGPVAQWPAWVQALAILVIGDFIGYWMHRAFHARRLWRFHAVHHSSVDLDWLAGLRTHPLNDVLQRLLPAIPALALGFAPAAVAGVLPVLALFAILLHANLDRDWGPLQTVIASPRFHRWHHTTEHEARDKNFAGLFPIWDILFGTYYMPSDGLPERFGTETAVPHTFAGQMLFPLRRSQPETEQHPLGEPRP